MTWDRRVFTARCLPKSRSLYSVLSTAMAGESLVASVERRVRGGSSCLHSPSIPVSRFEWARSRGGPVSFRRLPDRAQSALRAPD